MDGYQQAVNVPGGSIGAVIRRTNAIAIKIFEMGARQAMMPIVTH